MSTAIRTQLHALEALRDRPALLYHAALSDEALDVLYQCLCQLGTTDRLDLVLCTSGGYVTTTRRIALLLREYTRQLTILVPYRARSAGTLLCLSADQLVLTPLSELSPLDPCVSAVDGAPAGQAIVSAADIRAFKELAERWFGVTREEDRLQVLALVAQRFFPTSLSTFYRSEQLMRQIALELLHYQLPQSASDAQPAIVEQLVGGYCSHDYGITRKDARTLGLQVVDATPQEEQVLWELWQACRSMIGSYPGGSDGHALSVIASTTFQAHEVHKWIEAQRGYGQAEEPAPTGLSRWEIEKGGERYA